MMNTYGGNQEDRFEDITQHSNGKFVLYWRQQQH